MPITFVGSHVGTHAATSAQTVNFTSLLNESGANPTLQEGDLVLVAVENASTVDRTQAQLTPSGYTALHTDDYRNDSNDSNFLVSRKFMGATPDTSVAIPASNATTAGVAYAIYVFRGVDPTTPMDVTPVVTGNVNTGIANAAAITPVSAGAWIVVFGGAAVAAGAVFTNPSGMSTTTNHFRSATITTTTNDANIGGAIFTGWTSGAYDPAAFGGSTSTNTGSWSAVTLALRPIQPQTLTPALFVDDDTFHAATVVPGAVALTATLFENAQAFHEPTVTQPGGAQTLTVDLFIDGETFHAPTVVRGTVTLTAPLYADPDTFHAATVVLGPAPQVLTATRFDQANTFHPATLTARNTVTAPLIPSATQFHPATLTAKTTLTASLFVNGGQVFIPTVVPGAITLQVPHLINVNQFYSATLPGSIPFDGESLFPLQRKVKHNYSQVLVQRGRRAHGSES